MAAMGTTKRCQLHDEGGGSPFVRPRVILRPPCLSSAASYQEGATSRDVP